MPIQNLSNVAGTEATSSAFIAQDFLSGTLAAGATYTPQLLRCKGLVHQFIYIEQIAGVAGASAQIQFAISDFNNAGTLEFRFLDYGTPYVIPFTSNVEVNTHIPAVAIRLNITAGGGGGGNIFRVVLAASAS
jgi:hypothetical protein